MPDQAEFDAYYKWLGVPSNEQPPNFYRLLGVVLYESDADVIESAADQRMAHVRTFQAGKHSAVSQKILNELSEARLTLLNPAKKANYDARLRSQMSSPPPEPPVAIPVAAPVASPTVLSSMPRSVDRRKKASPIPVIGIGAATCLVLVGTLFVVFQGRDSTARRAATASSPQKSRSQPKETAKENDASPASSQVPVITSTPAVVPADERSAEDASPRILDRKTEIYHQDGSDVAQGDNGSFFVSLRAEVGEAAVGYELDGAWRLTVQAKIAGALRHHDENSFAGYIVDYHTPTGYTKRVALSLGLHDDHRTTGGPAWGKQTVPDQVVEIPALEARKLDLKRWAPPEWDGRVWFSVLVQNSGAETSIEGRFVFPPTASDDAHEKAEPEPTASK